MSKATANSNLYNCKPFGSYEELINDKTVDSVYIPLPNSLHYTFVKKAIENRKHVIVEKSLGLTLAEVKEMVDLARINKVVLLENFQFRFHSQLKTIQKILCEGVIGDLRSVRVSFGFPLFTYSANIRYNANLGGGALLDEGTYALKIAPYFFGKNVFVAQGSMCFDPIRNVDIRGQGVLKQRNGPLCG
jgi:NDP-hexose-3-ketoreductase